MGSAPPSLHLSIISGDFPSDLCRVTIDQEIMRYVQLQWSLDGSEAIELRVHRLLARVLDQGINIIKLLKE